MMELHYNIIINKFKILGVEPSSASKYAIKKGIRTEKNFFNSLRTRKLIKYNKTSINTVKCFYIMIKFKILSKV